jgi:hypothetical protein
MKAKKKKIDVKEATSFGVDLNPTYTVCAKRAFMWVCVRSAFMCVCVRSAFMCVCVRAKSARCVCAKRKMRLSFSFLSSFQEDWGEGSLF